MVMANFYVAPVSVPCKTNPVQVQTAFRSCVFFFSLVACFMNFKDSRSAWEVQKEKKVVKSHKVVDHCRCRKQFRLSLPRKDLTMFQLIDKYPWQHVSYSGNEMVALRYTAKFPQCQVRKLLMRSFKIWDLSPFSQCWSPLRRLSKECIVTYFAADQKGLVSKI